MPEFSHAMCAPWRLEYVRALAPPGAADECFLCKYWAHADADRANHVLWRTGRCFVALNRFPYNNGHLLIAPGGHQPSLADLDDAALAELFRMVRDAQRLLMHVLRPHGSNVGMNFGRCAGAGLPDHMHVHVVPRWDGDTNFMSIVGDTRVIPQDLDRLYADLVRAAGELGLPQPAASP